MKTLASLRLVPLALLPLLSACGGGGGGGGSSAAGADVFATDATVDGLLGFRIELESLRLRRTDATLTADLLSDPVTVEFLELEERLRWLVRGTLPAGTYDAAVVDFTPSSASAVAEDGSPVAVLAATDRWVAPFDAPLVVSGAYQRLELDLRLDDSLQGDASSGSIDFSPLGVSSGSSGSSAATIDEVQGTLVSLDAAQDRLVLDALVDDDPPLALGELTVDVPATALLLAEDGSAFASRAAFYASLVAGATRLEVHGRVGAGGRVDATRIEVEDALGGGGPLAVEIEGVVAAIDAGNGFTLVIREVEKGRAIAGPVLAGLGNPGSIEIAYDAGTVFVLHDDASGDRLTTDASLAVGQRVDVSFETFLSEPFPARRVEIRDEGADIEGVVTDVSGLPASFVMHVDGDEPAVTSGAVASSATDVQVDASQSAFRLQVHEKPALAAEDLLVGLRIEVRGALSGAPSAPTLAATLVKVKPGRLDDATVTGVDAGAGTFTTSGGDVEDPFGGGIGPGPLVCTVPTGARFEGDASDLADLAALFAGLGAGETLEVRVEGLATGEPSTIAAWEIDARVRD